MIQDILQTVAGFDWLNTNNVLQASAIFTGLYGSWLNAEQNIKGYYAWILGDVFFIVLNYRVGLNGLATLFLIYAALSLRGIVKWNQINKDEEVKLIGIKRT